jgi:hypothetical protein
VADNHFPLDLRRLAAALGGEIRGDQVLAPGPNHSAADRSMAVKSNEVVPDGFLVHSFANDDPIACKKYVRERCGLPPFQANGSRHRSHSEVANLLREAVFSQRQQQQQPRGAPTATYDYRSADGALLYQVVRFEPKTFRQRRPDGTGGWFWRLDERRVIYRWRELLKYPDGTVFFCEGEKDADRVASLGHCATTVAGGKWTEECVQALAGHDVIILEDNDEPGRKKALAAAQALHGTAKTIRIVSLPDLEEKGDVSDWLDADPRRAGKLVDICFDIAEWIPDGSTISNGHLAHNAAEAAVSAVDAGQNEPHGNLTDRTEIPSTELPGHNVRGDGGGRARSQADILIELARSAELFHTPDGKAFADFGINGHRETWKIQTKTFRRWLGARLF